MTVEDAFRKLLSDPEHAQCMEDSYVGYDVAEMARRFADSEEASATRELLTRHGIRQGRLLDAGAGNGISTYMWAREGFRVVALEPDPSSLVGRAAIKRMLTELHVEAEVIAAVGEALPVPGESFDVVYLRQVLHHARDLEMMLREIARCLRPGGLFLATREHVVSDDDELKAFLANHPIHRLASNENAYRMEEYLGAIAGAGLTLIETLGTFDTPINFYPMTREQVTSLCLNSRRSFVPRWVARWLLRSPRRLRRAQRRLSESDRRPGRLYTFVGQR